MNFINPKTDFAFKKIFASNESKAILISFLNALLYQAQTVIQDLEIIDPYLAPQIRGIKDTYLDVKAKLTGGETVIIEMQVLNVEAFRKRILYNATKTYSTQLVTGERYNLLNPVIALTITDFEMFDTSTEVISHFAFKEKQRLEEYIAEELEVFVELPKFNKKLEDLQSLTDKWIYFLKESFTLNDVPDQMKGVPEIQQAFSIANKANLTRQELEDLERREIFIQDRRGAISLATQIGIEQGMREGIKSGQAGLILSQLERRFGEISPDIATRIQRLSVEQLETLGIAVLGFNRIEEVTAWLEAAHR